MKSKGGEVDMAQEPFLINPPRKLRKRKRNPIGETLTVIGANPMGQNPWYGHSAGHRVAALMRWGKIRRGKITRRKVGRVGAKKVRKVVYRKRGRWAPAAVRRHRMLAKHAMWATKYGEILSHPRRKKYHYRAKGVKYYMKSIRRRNRARRRNTWFGQPRRHRKAAKKGWRRGHLLHAGAKRRRRVRHRNYFTNPMTVSANPRRRRSRHYNVKHRRRHRNPAMGAMLGRFTGGVMNVREWAPLAVTGGLAAITGAVVPGMLGVSNPWAKYGVQTALAIGGGLVVEQVVDKRHGQAWMIVGVAMVGYQLLKEFVLQPYFPQFAVGLGAYDYPSYYPTSAYENVENVSQQVGAFPGQMSAFPSAMSDYPGVGAYPYDGAGY